VRSLLLVLLAAGCGHASSPPAPISQPVPAVSSLLVAVGPHPRGYAKVSLADPQIRAQLLPLAAAAQRALGASLADCHIELARLDRLQIAVGEPVRFAAELDGKIDVGAITCLLGDDMIAVLARGGMVIRDRPGGVAIEYQVERGQTDAARVAGTDLASRCTGATCGAVVLGPPERRLWVQVGYGKMLRIRLGGAGLGDSAKAIVSALDGLRASTPALGPLVARAEGGALVIEVPGDLQTAPSVALALALRTHLLEAFRIPSSSMVPTLRVDDQVFVAKGPLLGTPVPGDLLVHTIEGRQYIKRYLAGPGQTIAETEAGLSIDGKPLATEVIDASIRYQDRDETDGRMLDRSGALVREHLGARSYLTLRTGPPHTTGSWTVPAGQVFFVGDNRNNSNDSRYQGASPQDTIVGRVVGVWFAFRDGAPDWNRMGVPVE
jgi:signal peptidase I